MSYIPSPPSITYDDLLMQYACGALDDGLALIVASHLCLSQTARMVVAQYECVGGALIEKNCQPVAMGESSLKSVLEKLNCPNSKKSCTAKKDTVPAPHNLPLPQPLCRHLSTLPAMRRSWHFIAPGISFMRLPLNVPDRHAALLRAKPGARAPHHEHKGLEITLVLHGHLHDDGMVYGPGDMIVMETHTSHHPVADPNHGCLCFVMSGAPRAGRHPLHNLLSRLLGR